jgi:hypothetical protein
VLSQASRTVGPEAAGRLSDPNPKGNPMTNPTRAASTIDRDGAIPMHARNATLSDLVAILRDQHARKVDVVAPATAIRSRGGVLHVTGADPIITDDGVTAADGVYRPTAVCDEGIAEKLRVPLSYVRRLRADRPDLFDANVNGWLHGRRTRRADGTVEETAPADGRSFLLRAFRGDDGGEGIARALLSDRYRIVDNLDVLMAALDGVRHADADVDIVGADLTDRRMHVRIAAPAVRELAPDLLGGYRSPFSGATGADNPVIFAGLVLSNSETGGGAFTLTPRLTIEVCNNGMTITKDALRSVHVGGRLEEGVVRWSDETQQKTLDLVRSQTADAVKTFLDVDYVRSVVATMREKAGVPVADPAATVQHVAKSLKFTEEAADAILDHFIRGGQVTAGGVMQAVTSYAQTVDDADVAADVEAAALDALALAAAAR